MKKPIGNNVRLGIFVSIGLLLFIICIYFVGQRQQLFSSTFHAQALFADVRGLQVGNNVRFAGINVGIINDMEQLTDTTVRVDMVIDQASQRFIKKNAKVIIGSDGLMGSKIVQIIPGVFTKDEIVNNDWLEVAPSVDMDDVMYKVKLTTDNLAMLSGDLAIILRNVSEGKGTIGKLLMDSVFAENVDQAIVNIRQGAGGFKQNMDAASHNFLLRGFLKKKAKKEDALKDSAKKANEKKANQKKK